MRALKGAILGLLAGATLAVVPAAVAGVPVTNRELVIISDDVVRLGDIFQNLASGENEPVAKAPAPGDRTQLDLDQLTAIAKANGIDWQPRGRGDRIVIERNSRVVDGAQVQRLLARTISDRMPGRDVEVDLESRLQPIHLPIGPANSIRFEDITIDAERVTATLVVPTGEGRESRGAVAGKIFPVVDVPVLAKPMMPGDEVRLDDLEWTKLRAGRLRQGVATDPRQIVGRTPRRPLAPGTPLTIRDMQERIVVSKNSLVTIVLHVPNMTLTTRGKALEDGAAGSAIRVASSSGDRTIEATVVGADLVEVRPAPSFTSLLGRK